MKRKIVKLGAATILAAMAMGAAVSSAWAGGALVVEFDPVNFTQPRVLNNGYWPLLPNGVPTSFIYLGETEDGCVFDKVTADPANMKMFMDSYPGYSFYDGIMAQVVVDREWELEDVECEDIIETLGGDPGWEPEEGLGEWTDDWYIQDDDMNIWYMGEASRDFGDAEIDGEEVECPSIYDIPIGSTRDIWLVFDPENGDDLFLECTGGSWEAGQPGQEEGEIIGEAGIVVPGDRPTGGELIKPGTYYMQEVAEGAEDMAKVLRVNAPLAVEDGIDPGEYEVCRKVKEWNPFENGQSVEHKWYCADGPGLVLIQGIGGGPTESEVLVQVTP